MAAGYDSKRTYVCQTCLSAFDEPDGRKHDGADCCPVCWSADIEYERVDYDGGGHTKQR